MRKEKPLVRCSHPHFCYEWDSMFITPLMPEFDACLCQCSGQGATSRKDFAYLDDVDEKKLQKYLDSLNN